MVIDATAAHRIQRVIEYPDDSRVRITQRLVEQQEQSRFVGKFGPATEATVFLIMVSKHVTDCQLQRRVTYPIGGLLRFAYLCHPVGNLLCLGQQYRSLPGPLRGNLLQQLKKPRRPIIITTKERLAIRDQKTRDWPTTIPGFKDQRIEISTIDIGPTFAIDLDRNKVAIEKVSDSTMIEALLFHHMTPVAGGITNRQEHRLVLRPGPGERWFSPGIPVHRIVRMLDQVG